MGSSNLSGLKAKGSSQYLSSLCRTKGPAAIYVFLGISNPSSSASRTTHRGEKGTGGYFLIASLNKASPMIPFLRSDMSVFDRVDDSVFTLF